MGRATLPHILEPRQPGDVVKSDRRSRVWRREADGRPCVFKRLETSPLRQTLAAIIWMHPLQRERRRHAGLAKRGLRVVPVINWGWQWSGLGWRGWLATPYKGLSLHWLLRESPPWAVRRAVARSVAELLGQLIDAELFNRDMKASNIVIDERRQAWLIDAGGVRRNAGRRAALRMLATLDETARIAGATRTDRLAVLCELTRIQPALGAVRDVLEKMRRRG